MDEEFRKDLDDTGKYLFPHKYVGVACVPLFSGRFPPPLCAVKEKGQNMLLPLKSIGKELIFYLFYVVCWFMLVLVVWLERSGVRNAIASSSHPRLQFQSCRAWVGLHNPHKTTWSLVCVKVACGCCRMCKLSLPPVCEGSAGSLSGAEGLPNDEGDRSSSSRSTAQSVAQLE